MCATSAGDARDVIAELRAPRSPAGEGARPRARGGRHASVQPPQGSGDRRRAALHRVRRVPGDLRAAPGRERPPRARRHAERRCLLPCARGNAPLAAGDPRDVGELAVSRRRGNRPGLEPRRGARSTPAKRRAAGFPLLRGVGGVHRPFRAAGNGRRLHPLLVGRAAASEVRDARGADARPADEPRSHRSLHRARPGALRDRPGERSTRVRPCRGAASTSRTAGERSASGSRRSSSIRAASGSPRRPSSRPS